MNTLFSRRVLFQLAALVCGGLMLACQAGAGGASGSGNKWADQAVYARVGMRVEPVKKGAGWHMYSTNHIGLPKYFAPGSKFTARNVGGSRLELVAEDGSAIKVEFVARHHPDLNFETWMERELSLTPVELPDNLNDKERAAIQEGRYEVGLSRAALFLAIGYPPTTLSPTLSDPTLKYEVKRFSSISFSFDAQDRISDIKN